MAHVHAAVEQLEDVLGLQRKPFDGGGERIFSGYKREHKRALTASLSTPDVNVLGRGRCGIPTR